MAADKATMVKARKERIISCVVSKPQIAQLQTDKRFSFAFTPSPFFSPSVSGLFEMEAS